FKGGVMILRQATGVASAWGFAALIFAAWTAAASGPGSPAILQYGFYATAGFAYVLTAYTVRQSHREYVASGDGTAYIVVRVFQAISYALLIGTALAVAFNPGWFFPRQ
ncbi:MAG TPA: hypothetical protein VGB98_26305, partial [Pyrinomonadaceae bacterium]